MTALIGSADCPPALLAATRDSLHRVAEHVLAAAWYAASGEISLAPSPGGFRTPSFGPDGRYLTFDVGITAAAVNYGASPGDEHIAEPYPYAGPHDGPPPGDPAFWNAPFGAARTWRQIGTVAEATTFFHDARAHVTTPARRTS
jgi:hypothetical protein